MKEEKRKYKGSKEIARTDFKLKPKCHNCENFLKKHSDITRIMVKEYEDGTTGHILIGDSLKLQQKAK